MLSQSEHRVSDSIKELSPILATVLYEDLESGLRARALMESVEANMDFPAEFQLDLWRFDWLAERSLGSIALSRADRSALVLISLGSANPLPVAAEKWINTWVQMEQSHPLALVVLLPKEKRGGESYHPMHEHLRAVARQKGVDFFCEFFEPSAAGQRGSISEPKVEEKADHQFQFGNRTARDPDWQEGPGRSASARPVRVCNPVSPSEADAASSKEVFQVDCADVLNNVTLADMNPKTRRQSGLPHDCEGVVVSCIDSGSAAFRAGLRVGDVIQQMDRQDVKGAAEALSLSHRTKSKNVLLRIWSQGDTRFLVVSRPTGMGKVEKPICSQGV